MLDELVLYGKILTLYGDFRPQRLTLGAVSDWLSTFDKADRRLVLRLMTHIRFITEHECRRELVAVNRTLLRRLKEQGIGSKKVIYVSIDEAGSSSPLMLSMLRDAGGLHQRGCILLDSRDVRRIREATDRLGDGAIVYIDDFIGSGEQLLQARKELAQYVVGSFSEFVLSPVICEEGLLALDRQGIEGRARYIHGKSERPLHADSAILSADQKKRLVELCERVDKKAPLGYMSMATMYVLYRNSPNSIPRLLRGSVRQTPFTGPFPRVQDLPVDD